MVSAIWEAASLNLDAASGPRRGKNISNPCFEMLSIEVNHEAGQSHRFEELHCDAALSKV